MGKTEAYSLRTNKTRSIRDAISDFMAKRDAGANIHLSRLWDHWEMVMGPELSAFASPLGHRNRILLIGVDDAMAAQEIAMQTPEILERVNAFMDSRFFDKVQIELMQNRANLAKARVQLEFTPPPMVHPERLGGLKDVLDPESPIGRCYHAYLRALSK